MFFRSIPLTRYCKLTVVLEVTKISFFSFINIEHFGSKLVISLRFRDVNISNNILGRHFKSTKHYGIF